MRNLVISELTCVSGGSFSDFQLMMQNAYIDGLRGNKFDYRPSAFAIVGGAIGGFYLGYYEGTVLAGLTFGTIAALMGAVFIYLPSIMSYQSGHSEYELMRLNSSS